MFNEGRFKAAYYNENGKYITKSFSASKYGYDEAKEMARIWRNDRIRELEEFGIVYGENHTTCP